MYDNGFGRILGVLVSPGKTFRSIAERPTWVAPLLVLVLLSGVMATLITQRMDMTEMIRHRIEESGRQVPQETIDRQVEFAERFGWVFGLIGVVVTPIIYLIGAAIFFGVFKLLGSDFTFKQAFSTFLAVGYRTVAKVSAATATATVVVLWLVLVGVKVGWAALFG